MKNDLERYKRACSDGKINEEFFMRKLRYLKRAVHRLGDKHADVTFVSRELQKHNRFDEAEYFINETLQLQKHKYASATTIEVLEIERNKIIKQKYKVKITELCNQGVPTGAIMEYIEHHINAFDRRVISRQYVKEVAHNYHVENDDLIK